MRWRNLFLFGVLVAACIPSWVSAQEARTAAPLLVRVHSLDEAKTDLGYFGKMIGREEIAALVNLIPVPVVDTAEPFGLYAHVGAKPAVSALVGMLPIVSEKQFVNTLAQFKIKLTKLDGGIHAFSDMAHPLHVRFAKGYAYVAAGNKDTLLGDKLLDPKALVAADPFEVFSVTVKPDQVPAAFKKEITDWIANTSRLAQQFTIPFEDEKDRALRASAIKLIGEEHLMWMQEAAQFSHVFRIDRKANRIVAETKLAAKPGSKLAGRFADCGKGTSLFAAMSGGDPVMSGVGHYQAPAEHRRLLADLIDRAMLDLEKEAKARHHEADFAVIKSLTATLKSGTSDHGFALRGPGEAGLYTFVGGARLKDGVAIEKALRARLKELPEDRQKSIHWDAEKVGEVKVHRVLLPEQLARHHVKMFGKNTIYFTFRDDALFVAMGDKALPALEEAMSAKEKAAPAGQFSLSVARVALGHAKDAPAIAKAAKQVFGDSKDAGKISVVVEGGEVVRMRFEMDANIVKFAARAITAR